MGSRSNSALALLLIAGAGLPLAARPLDIYTIDVEGGKSVLMVSPSGQSMLFDVGWPGFNGRDTERIVAAAKAAKLKAIDFLVISHFDVDHMGDVPALVAKFPVKRIVDHGPLHPARTPDARFLAYAELREKIPHTAVQAGDRIPIRGIDVQVVTAAMKWITKPLKGGGVKNPVCESQAQEPEIARDVEDNSSIGLVISYGKFRMLDFADLESHYDYKVMCPENPVGNVDVYHVSIHGQDKGVSPVLAHAIGARVAIMGNGPRKGGAPKTWQTLKSSPVLEDIWQVHYSMLGTKETNPPEDFIANLDANCQGKWIKLSAESNGTYTVTNSRNGFSKTYKPKK